jgi:hypothetical protein
MRKLQSAYFSFFLMSVFHSHKRSSKMCLCILLNYVFQNIRVEFVPRPIGNRYSNMQIVLFEREYLGVIVVCL